MDGNRNDKLVSESFIRKNCSCSHFQIVFRHGYGISSFDATGGSLCNTGAQDTLAGGSAKAEMFTTLTIVGETDKSVSVHLFNQAAYEDPRVTAGYICERDSKYFQTTDIC